MMLLLLLPSEQPRRSNVSFCSLMKRVFCSSSGSQFSFSCLIVYILYIDDSPLSDPSSPHCNNAIDNSFCSICLGSSPFPCLCLTSQLWSLLGVTLWRQFAGQAVHANANGLLFSVWLPSSPSSSPCFTWPANSQSDCIAWWIYLLLMLWMQHAAFSFPLDVPLCLVLVLENVSCPIF